MILLISKEITEDKEGKLSRIRRKNLKYTSIEKKKK
jgi:hypothetical protein